MQSKSLAERIVVQSFGLETGQLLKLRELAQRSGQSVSKLVREAVDQYLLKQSAARMDPKIMGMCLGAPQQR